MKRAILLTTDFSPTAEAAYPQAVRLARSLSLPIRLLHVIDEVAHWAPGSTSNSPAWYRHLHALFGEKLEAVAEGLAAHAVNVEPVVTVGRTVRDIAAQAEEHAALVVIGSHGYSGFRRLFLGSVATQVVRLSPAPVLVVRPDTPDRPWSRVLFGTDLSDATDGAVRQVIDLLKPTGAAVEAYHACILPGLVSLLRGEAWTPPPDLTLSAQTEALRSQVQEVAARLAARGVASSAHVDDGGRRAAEAICQRADTHDFDLIAVASHGRGALAAAWLGSVTEEVLRRANQPVLVLKPGRGASTVGA